MSTEEAISAITDEGLFEKLATSILREFGGVYKKLVHCGVNVEGKTIKAPIDAICFEGGADPPHMIAVHHTTTALNSLKKKWLYDPTKVMPKKGSKRTAPAGDLIKTYEIVKTERDVTPNLRSTLVLTTNQEPGEELVRAVEMAGRERKRVCQEFCVYGL